MIRRGLRTSTRTALSTAWTQVGTRAWALRRHNEGMAEVVVFGGLPFLHVSRLEPDRSPDGTVTEFLPQARYAGAGRDRLNPHGVGPFCRFRAPGAPAKAGVYVVTSEGQVRYVGIAQNLAQRWGLAGYGSIQPKNCYVGGQSTNCKVNARVLGELKAGRNLDLYFLDSEDRQRIEARLIRDLGPPWNGRQSPRT